MVLRFETCVLAVLVFVVQSSSYAEAIESEYYFQPKSNQSAFTALYSLTSAPLEQRIDSLSSDIDARSQDILLRYEYGLDEKKTIGVYSFLGFKEYESKISPGSDNTNTANGVGDIHIYLKGIEGDFRYTIDLGVNVDESKIDPTTGLQDNRTSGGSSLTLRAGRIWTYLSWNYGLDSSILILGERKLNETSTFKEQGGNIFRVAWFSEYNFGTGFAGFELAYNLIDQIKVKTNTRTLTMGSESFPRVVLFGSWILTDNWAAIVRLEQTFHEGQNLTPTISEFKGYVETAYSLGVRSSF